MRTSANMNEIPKALSRLEPRIINHYKSTAFEGGQQCCLYDYNISLATCFFSQAIKQWRRIISHLNQGTIATQNLQKKEREFPKKWECCKVVLILSLNRRNETLNSRVLMMALFTIGFCCSTVMFVAKHGYFVSGSLSYTSIIFSIISHSLSFCKSSTKT
jgi:hypothetical protein